MRSSSRSARFSTRSLHLRNRCLETWAFHRAKSSDSSNCIRRRAPSPVPRRAGCAVQPTYPFLQLPLEWGVLDPQAAHGVSRPEFPKSFAIP